MSTLFEDSALKIAFLSPKFETLRQYSRAKNCYGSHVRERHLSEIEAKEETGREGGI